MTNQLLAELEMAKKEIERLNKELEFEKLKNKEVREYIEKNYDDYEEFIYGKEFKEKILEILDKAGDEK